MFLGDYMEALEILIDALESEYSVCIKNIVCSAFGDRFLFYPSLENECYVVFPKTGRVEYHYSDTWRNPEHRVIIKEGARPD